MQQSSDAGSACGGGEEGEPLVPVVQNDVVVCGEQLATGGRKEGDNFNFWEVCFEPVDHFLARLFGRVGADDKHIHILGGGQGSFGGLVVGDRDDVVATAAKEFGARVQIFFVVADLKDDLLHMGFDGDFFAGLVISDDVFAGRKCRELFNASADAFEVVRLFDQAKAAVAFHLADVKLLGHGY